MTKYKKYKWAGGKLGVPELLVIDGIKYNIGQISAKERILINVFHIPYGYIDLNTGEYVPSSIAPDRIKKKLPESIEYYL